MRLRLQVTGINLLPELQPSLSSRWIPLLQTDPEHEDPQLFPGSSRNDFWKVTAMDSSSHLHRCRSHWPLWSLRQMAFEKWPQKQSCQVAILCSHLCIASNPLSTVFVILLTCWNFFLKYLLHPHLNFQSWANFGWDRIKGKRPLAQQKSKCWAGKFRMVISLVKYDNMYFTSGLSGRSYKRPIWEFWNFSHKVYMSEKRQTQYISKLFHVVWNVLRENKNTNFNFLWGYCGSRRTPMHIAFHTSDKAFSLSENNPTKLKWNDLLWYILQFCVITG